VFARFRPLLPVDFLQTELGFTARQPCMDFLQQMGVVFNADQTKIDCKASAAAAQVK